MSTYFERLDEKVFDRKYFEHRDPDHLSDRDCLPVQRDIQITVLVRLRTPRTKRWISLWTPATTASPRATEAAIAPSQRWNVDVPLAEK